MLNKPELLAPAGSLEKAKWAFMYGADAVYIGGQDYSLRANARNFNLEQIEELCNYAHENGKKVYVTLNIVFHDKDYKDIENHLIALKNANVDAVIVSDHYIMKLVRELIPEVELHISTQTSTLNIEAVKYFESLGAKRVVLGRELSEKEIKDIKENTNMDLEIFIHGATCSSYSGRCVLSNYLTNRDSNRGGCSQICRWNFTLCENEDKCYQNKPLFSMSTKDMSMLKYIPSMIEVGVSSLKIEGRMRSIYYIATVVHTYRKVIDSYFKGNYKYDIKEEQTLRRCANRDSVPHFYNRFPDEKEQYYIDRQENSNQDFLAIVLDYKDGIATLEQRNHFRPNDSITVFGPNTEEFTFIVKEIKDEEGNILDAARHPQQIVKIPIPKKVQKNDILRINY